MSDPIGNMIDNGFGRYQGSIKDFLRSTIRPERQPTELPPIPQLPVTRHEETGMVPLFLPERNRFIDPNPDQVGEPRPNLSWFQNQRLPNAPWGLLGPSRPNNNLGPGDEIEALLRAVSGQ